jgi:uncharacterized membrane protein
MKKRLAVIILLAVTLLLSAAPALAQTPTPGGGIVIASPFPAIIGEKGKPITFPLEIVNSGADWQDLTLKVDGPAAWGPVFKQNGSTVLRVMVGPAKSQALELQIKPADTAAAGNYGFTVQTIAKDGKVAAELKLSVGLEDRVAPTGLRLSTQYPENRGQPGTTYSWRVTLNNDAEKERVVNFSASLPQGWDIAFKAGYDNRQITNLSVAGASPVDVNIDIITPSKAEAGDYTLTLRVSAEKDVAELPLKITLIGNTKISLTTATGQLNANATVDKETTLTLNVANTGTAPVTGIAMSSSKPDGWTVAFSPEKIEQLPVGETTQVNVTLKPGSKVLAGDYMVSMSAYVAGGTSDNKEIRVTVETPTTWGIAAIVAIVVVVGGLALIFARFSRR